MSILCLIKEYMCRYPIICVGHLLFSVLGYLFETIVIPSILGSLFAHTNEPSLLRNYLLKIFGSWVLSRIFFIVSDALFDYIYMALERFITFRLLSQLLKKMDHSIESINVSAAYNMIEAIRHNIGSLLLTMTRIIPSLISLFCSSIYIFMLNKTIGTIILGNFLLIVIMFSREFLIQDNQSEAEDKIILDTLYDSCKNMNMVRSTENGIVTEINSLEQLINHQSHMKYNEYTQNRFKQILVYIINLILTGIILYILYQYGKQKHLPYEQLNTLLLTISPYMNLFNTITTQLPIVSKSLGILYHYDPFIKELLSYTLSPPLLHRSSMIFSLDSVTFSYPDQPPIFKEWTITLPSGLVWLKGESGSGKTTLLKLLLGILTPTSGTIRMGDELITTSINYYISFLHQHASSSLFKTTLYHNIMYGQEETLDKRKQLSVLLHTYRIHSVFGCEDGDESFLQRIGGEQLSGGQTQLIHLLRCILLNRSFYIMDEPLAGLDPDTQERVVQLIRDLIQNGKTVYIISHEPLHFPQQHVMNFIKGQNPYVE